jgi:hypothetical protein
MVAEWWPERRRNETRRQQDASFFEEKEAKRLLIYSRFFPGDMFHLMETRENDERHETAAA